MSFLAETFFMESTSDNVKELNIIMEQSNIDFMKIDQMFTMVESQREINLKASELKVVVESGTMEDLEMLYEAANTEANGKKKGIISSAIAAIKKFFGNIIDFIDEKILKRKGVSGNVTVDKSVIAQYDAIQKADGEVKGAIAKIKSGQIPDIAKVLASIAAIATISVAGTVVVKKTDLISKIKNLKKKSEDTSDSAESLDGNENAEKADKSFWNIFHKFGSVIMGVVKKMEQAIYKIGKEPAESLTDDDGYADVKDDATDQKIEAYDKENKRQSIDYADFGEKAKVKTEDIFGADYMYESAMSELEQMIDEL